MAAMHNLASPLAHTHSHWHTAPTSTPHPAVEGLKFGAGRTNPPGASPQAVTGFPTTAARSIQVEIQLEVTHAMRVQLPLGHGSLCPPQSLPPHPHRSGHCTGRTLLTVKLEGEGWPGIRAAPWHGCDSFHRSRMQATAASNVPIQSTV